MQSAGYISILNTEVVGSSRMLGAYLPEYMVSHSKRQHSSEQCIFKFYLYKLHPLFFTFQHWSKIYLIYSMQLHIIFIVCTLKVHQNMLPHVKGSAHLYQPYFTGVCIYIYTHTHTHTHTHTYIYIYIYIYTHTHTHKHTYIHTYIHTHTKWFIKMLDKSCTYKRGMDREEVKWF